MNNENESMPSGLPADPEGMNDKRSAWAATAILQFQSVTGADEEDALSDLLSDLMHWSDRNHFDFNAALDRARWHYEAETSDRDVGTEIPTLAAGPPLKPFDGYEIAPCLRCEEPSLPDHFYFEPCAPHDADVWTLYGHLTGQGVEAIGDFATRAHAEEIYARITGKVYGAAVDRSELVE